MKYRKYSILATAAAYASYCINWLINGYRSISLSELFLGIFLVFADYVLSRIYESRIAEAITETEIVIAALYLTTSVIVSFISCLYISHIFLVHLYLYAVLSYLNNKT